MSADRTVPLTGPLTVMTAPVDGWCEPDGAACHVPGVSDATPPDDPGAAALAAPPSITDPRERRRR